MPRQQDNASNQHAQPQVPVASNTSAPLSDVTTPGRRVPPANTFVSCGPPLPNLNDFITVQPQEQRTQLRETTEFPPTRTHICRFPYARDAKGASCIDATPHTLHASCVARVGHSRTDCLGARLRQPLLANKMLHRLDSRPRIPREYHFPPASFKGHQGITPRTDLW